MLSQALAIPFGSSRRLRIQANQLYPHVLENIFSEQ
jgi:hypothetical protein